MTWQLLVPRLLFLTERNNQTLAEAYGVEPSTVSRWRSGKSQPDVATQKRMRDELRRYDPSTAPELVAMMPGHMGHLFQEDLTKVHSITRASAANYGLTPEQALEQGGPAWLPEVVCDLYTELCTSPEWRNGELAGFEGYVKRGDDQLWRCVAWIIPQSRLVKWSSEPCCDHFTVDQWLVPISFDELREKLPGDDA